MIVRPQRKLGYCFNVSAFQQWQRRYGLLAVILLISVPTVTIIGPSFLVSTNNNNLDENGLSAATPSTAVFTSAVRATSLVSFSSPVRIVMLLGIEGTGHHFWQDLLKESPSFSRLKDLGIYPTFTKPILKSLYRHKKGRWKALWSATCKWNETDPSPNITEIQDTLVEALQNLTQHVEVTRSSSSSSVAASPIIIPINLLGSGNENGFVSYPGFLKPCRALSYPNMDVWYQVCQKARVDCEHAYIYRNPYSVVRSTTTNRPLNVGIMEAIHLYTTQLHVLHTQLVTFPHQLIGCLNYDTMMSPTQFRDEINPLFGFPNDEAFLSTLKKVFVPKKPPKTVESQREIVPAEFDLYMQSMVRAYEMTIKTCTDLTKQNRMA
jgi:hypothetical protein